MFRSYEIQLLHNIVAETVHNKAEQSTCQTGFKGVELGHTPEAKTADRQLSLALSLYSQTHLPRI